MNSTIMSKIDEYNKRNFIPAFMDIHISKMLQMLAIYAVLFYFGYCEDRTNRLVDLTHPFDNKTLYWPVFKPFDLDIQYRGMSGDFWFEANNFAAAEHGGTHMDAPSHFAKGKWRMGDIPIDLFFGTAVVVDITDKSKTNPDAELETEDLHKWEEKYGRIPDGSYVFMYSGWDQHWHSELLYVGNTAKDVNNLHFPGISAPAAEWLVNHRNIRAVGVDTASIDHGPSKEFLSHRIFYQQNIFGFENVNNLKHLPPKGAKIYAFPMKIKDGSGAPVRIIADITNGSALKGWRLWITLGVTMSFIILFL